MSLDVFCFVCVLSFIKKAISLTICWESSCFHQVPDENHLVSYGTVGNRRSKTNSLHLREGMFAALLAVEFDSINPRCIWLRANKI